MQAMHTICPPSTCQPSKSSSPQEPWVDRLQRTPLELQGSKGTMSQQSSHPFPGKPHELNPAKTAELNGRYTLTRPPKTSHTALNNLSQLLSLSTTYILAQDHYLSGLPLVKPIPPKQSKPQAEKISRAERTLI